MKREYYPRFVFIPFFCVLLILASSKCRCQNKIYLESSEIFGKVIEITPEKIKYKRIDNFDGPLYSISRNRVELLFNEAGGYLIIPKLDSINPKQADNLISKFLFPSKKTSELDKLFTIEKNQINCTILDEDSLLYSINYNNLNFKYNKASVAVAIYKDGKHKIVSDLNTAIGVLSTLESAMIAKTGISYVKKASSNASSFKSNPSKGVQNSDNKYKIAITNAQSFFENEEYEYAKAAYLIAAALKPDEKEPKERIDSINNIIIYDSLVRSAGNFLLNENYDSALVIYKKILELKTGDYFASLQVEYLKEQITKKEAKEEIRRKKEIENRYREIEKSYRNAITKGDDLKTAGDYKSALDAYKIAAAIHPEDEYVQKNIQILTYQLKIKADNNKHD